MPLLHRILKRLALVALIGGVALVYLIMGADTFRSPGVFLGCTLVGAIPAAVIAALAWVVKPSSHP